MARGRNIFPKEQHRGRGGRVNNLFKRFQAQHRDKLGEPEGDLLYDGFDTVKSRRERISRTRTRSRSRGRNDRRSRKRSASSSSDSSRSSSSSEDSDAHKKKKRKIKKEKKEKKAKKAKKEKKIDNVWTHHGLVSAKMDITSESYKIKSIESAEL